jgi:Domain of unknown function (DUF1883)
MNYLKFPLNYQSAGVTVEVTLRGVESDVLLMDSSNLSSFERGAGQVNSYGGHYKASPVGLTVPTSGTWTVVVIPGPGGTVHASVRTIAAA